MRGGVGEGVVKVDTFSHVNLNATVMHCHPQETANIIENVKKKVFNKLLNPSMLVIVSQK